MTCHTLITQFQELSVRPIVFHLFPAPDFKTNPRQYISFINISLYIYKGKGLFKKVWPTYDHN